MKLYSVITTVKEYSGCKNVISRWFREAMPQGQRLIPSHGVAVPIVITGLALSLTFSSETFFAVAVGAGRLTGRCISLFLLNLPSCRWIASSA
jgi:hypothetical protein